MKIRIKSNPITQFGSFSIGDELDDTKYPLEFLNHLVDDCDAADRIEYETKIDNDFIAKKKPQSSPSLQPDKALQKKTVKSRKKKRK